MMRTRTTTAGMIGTVISDGFTAHKKQKQKKSNKHYKMKDVRIEVHPHILRYSSD